MLPDGNEEEVPMFKRLAVFAMVLTAGAAVLPAVAEAQDLCYRPGYYAPAYVYRGRDWREHERRERLERERHERVRYSRYRTDWDRR
jgi:hypothetical protein